MAVGSEGALGDLASTDGWHDAVPDGDVWTFDHADVLDALQIG